MIKIHRIIRYLKVSLLLHIISIAGIELFFLSSKLAMASLDETRRLAFFIQGCFGLYSLILVFFAQKDAFCRFQNYKRAKDLFFKNGFKKRIVNLFIGSRCQRDAIKVAADDLGMIKELKDYYSQMGYRWYHVIPDIVITEPARLFSSGFWKNTFFTPRYTSKYFLW